MRRARYKYYLGRTGLSLLLVSMFFSSVLAQDKPPVPEDYQKFFVHYVDNRSISEKALNLVNLTLNDVGRSFALIAGVSNYPNMSLINQELRPAAEDIKKLQDYLITYEFFDEIVVLKNGEVTTENLEFFLQTYFPRRLRKFPKSRFLFAYSGHGMNEGSDGYLLKNTARSLTDKDNSINLGVIRVLVDEEVKSGHHVLVLINACYSGAFLKWQTSFGGPKKLIQKHPGAHAITAGGTGEKTWHIPSVGKGSLFFEKVFAGLDDRADTSGDGIITVYELFNYLMDQVQISTDQNQNPQVGDLTINKSKGQFFFLNRDRQVSKGVLPEWKPEVGTVFGIKAKNALIKGKEHFKLGFYEKALASFQQAAEADNNEAMFYIAYIYEAGLGVTRDFDKALPWLLKAAKAGNSSAMLHLGILYEKGREVDRNYSKAEHWYRNAAEAGNTSAMIYLGYMYEIGRGVEKDYSESLFWYRKAAEIGDINAMLSLGYMYQNGLGVKKNDFEADRWFFMAEQADKPSKELGVKHIYDNRQELQKNYFEALRYGARGGIYNKIGNRNRAIDFLTKAIQLGFEPVDWALSARGEAYRATGQYSKAIDDLTQAIKLNPKPAGSNPQGWYYAARGEAYRLSGQYSKAIDDLTQAIKLNPKAAGNPQGWYYAALGGAYYSNGNYKEAIYNITEALELGYEPAYWAYACRGGAYQMIKMHDEAINDLTEAIELNPTYSWAYSMRAKAYFSKGKFDLFKQDEKKAKLLENQEKGIEN